LSIFKHVNVKICSTFLRKILYGWIHFSQVSDEDLKLRNKLWENLLILLYQSIFYGVIGDFCICLHFHF
jgi:hypothetical protein